MCVLLQEQLKHDVAGLQKQLASQKRGFEEEAKAREQLQEDHERELRHLKRDIKHKLVGLQPRCLLLDAQIEQGSVLSCSMQDRKREEKSLWLVWVVKMHAL